MESIYHLASLLSTTSEPLAFIARIGVLALSYYYVSTEILKSVGGAPRRGSVFTRGMAERYAEFV